MLSGNITRKIRAMLRIAEGPVIRVYDGYGDKDELIVYGHVLKLAPTQRKSYNNYLLVNFFSLLRLFIVTPVPFACVRLHWNGEMRESKADKDGLFRFEWKPVNELTPGWHKARAEYLAEGGAVISMAECNVFIPHVYQYNFISDIDDTFLVSHSGHFLKRLNLLFSRNPTTRKPFKGVAEHYRLLSMAGVTNGIPNPFFYVSSSEWNLYDYLREFCRRQEMPRGVFLLNQLKGFHHLLKTGQGKHASKYIRIAKVMKSYPDHLYILLGDNSQDDPYIYAAIVRDFPGKVKAVYIRKVSKSNEKKTRISVEYMQERGVACCLFEHSSEAKDHSRAIGLI
jgi:phosphatidate phosphatase APP1